MAAVEPVLRDACDVCHRRKTRCLTQGTGACVACRTSGRTCVFSPRSNMGRPRRGAAPEGGRPSRRHMAKSSTATPKNGSGAGPGVDEARAPHAAPKIALNERGIPSNSVGGHARDQCSDVTTIGVEMVSSYAMPPSSALSWDGELGMSSKTYMTL